MISDIRPSYSGKVRDLYGLGDRLLIVATDRVSAFDVVFAEPIPDKGKILSTLSWWWFRESGIIDSIVPNHTITNDPAEYPEPFRSHADLLRGRSMLVRKTTRIDFECVVRGYITGSAWAEYRERGTVNGESAAADLVDSGPFPEPIFMPATKAATGHDENISFSRMRSALPPGIAERMREISLALYAAAARYVESRGLILADTKFEFGSLPDGSLMLIDEVLTPDSSRYWSRAEYLPGRPQAPFDKQFLRNYLETLDWKKEPPPPPLPATVITETRGRYLDAFRLITGKEFTA